MLSTLPPQSNSQVACGGGGGGGGGGGTGFLFTKQAVEFPQVLAST